MGRLGIGVIGLGWWGAVHAQIYSQLPSAELVAVCSRTEARAKEIAAKYGAFRWYTDYRELIQDPKVQAVSVVTREEEHFAPAMAAIEAGKHVLLEKPITQDLGEAERILAAARRAKVHVMPGFELRFEARHAMVKERIDAGHLGDILYVRARRNTQKRMLERFGRSHPAFVLCSHDVDLILWYLRDRVVRVRAYERAVNWPGENPNMVMALLEFEGGALAFLESIWMIPNAVGIRQGNSMEVIGTKGVANLDWINRGLSFWEDEGYSVPDASLAPEVDGTILGAMREELSYFVGCILRGKAPAVASLGEALDGLKVVLAIIESARAGEEVKVVSSVW